MAHDIAVFAPGAPFYSQNLLVPDERTALLTGPQRLAQSFVIRLLTGRGSMQYLANEGTSFADRVLHGHIATETDILQSFSVSMLYIRDRFNAEVTATTPENEQLRDAVISKIVIQPGSVLLGINVIARSLDQVSVLIPLEFNF